MKYSLFASWIFMSMSQSREEATEKISLRKCLRPRVSSLRSLHTTDHLLSWEDSCQSIISLRTMCLKTTTTLFLTTIFLNRAQVPLQSLQVQVMYHLRWEQTCSIKGKHQIHQTSMPECKPHFRHNHHRQLWFTSSKYHSNYTLWSTFLLQPLLSKIREEYSQMLEETLWKVQASNN